MIVDLAAQNLDGLLPIRCPSNRCVRLIAIRCKIFVYGLEFLLMISIGRCEEIRFRWLAQKDPKNWIFLCPE